MLKLKKFHHPSIIVIYYNFIKQKLRKNYKNYNKKKRNRLIFILLTEY